MIRRALVVGGGIFGTTAALALARRGASVTLLDAGPIPNARASSHDISKLVRMEYGSDVFYTALMERAFAAWEQWNQAWPRPLLHVDGWLVLSRKPMVGDGFEAASHRLLGQRGHSVTRLDPAALASRHPAWSAALIDGFHNARVAWAESAAVVAALAVWARDAGVCLRPDTEVAELLVEGRRVHGVSTSTGERIEADVTVVAAGAWTPRLVPWLADRMWVVGQPVFHLKPQEPHHYHPPAFPAFAADIDVDGWYGFPANADGIVKIANHGVGVRVDPDAPRVFPEAVSVALRAFLRRCIPGLADAPIAHRKVCLYCDSFDSDFFIDRDPDHDGLVVAAGGSGHGFKFAPLLGDIVADVVESGLPADLARFGWRQLGQRRKEAARASATSTDPQAPGGTRSSFTLGEGTR